MLANVPRQRIPVDVLDAAHARLQARAARDWAEADRLRQVIESSGWRVIDRGIDFALEPARPADFEEAGRVRYGSSDNVPSRLADPPQGYATVVLSVDTATVEPELDLARIAALERVLPAQTSLVVVADGPSDEVDRALDGIDVGGARSESGLPLQVIQTSARLGPAGAINAGLRRGTAPVVVVLDPIVEPTGDFVSPLVRALDDTTVAIAGPWGLVTSDLRHFAPGDRGDVDAISGACQAFRRADYVARGPLDEKFRSTAYLDAWWSFVLRDEGAGRPPRRAVAIESLPLVRPASTTPEGNGAERGPTDRRDRSDRRDFYRYLDRFGRRFDLRNPPGAG